MVGQGSEKSLGMYLEGWPKTYGANKRKENKCTKVLQKGKMSRDLHIAVFMVPSKSRGLVDRVIFSLENWGLKIRDFYSTQGFLGERDSERNSTY